MKKWERVIEAVRKEIGNHSDICAANGPLLKNCTLHIDLTEELQALEAKFDGTSQD